MKEINEKKRDARMLNEDNKDVKCEKRSNFLNFSINEYFLNQHRIQKEILIIRIM